MPSALPDGLRPFPDGTKELLQLEPLAAIAGFTHAFETRAGNLAAALASPVARIHQVHGTIVHRLPAKRHGWEPFLDDEPQARPAGDALITDIPGVTVAISVADCLPILVADPVGSAVAAVHGGWRGLAQGVLAAALAALADEFGCRPADCVVGIGPGIGPCCYQVGPDVIDAFAARGLATAALASGKATNVPQADEGPAERRLHCNLSAAAIAQAVRCGAPREQIFEAGLCTRCHGDWLWSYRRDGEVAGRMLGGIVLEA